MSRFVIVLMMLFATLAWSAPAANAAINDTAPDAAPSNTAAPGDSDSMFACGNAGEIACINIPSLTYATPFNGCNSNRLNNLLNVCYECGGPGQVACDFGPKCDAGYRTVPPVGTCSSSGFSAEPTTNVASMPTLTQPATGPVRGIIDMHAHMFSNLGFGGVLFWGAPYDQGGINEALPWCDYSWKFPTSGFTGLPGTLVPFLGYEMHGPTALQPLAHPISLAMEEGLHPVPGTGSFEGWPTYQTLTHQQMYHKWVERAYLGGLRMMVQLAVSNEAICGSSKRRSDFSCDDMEAVDKQIQATKDLERAIDLLDDGHANGSGWYRIAYKPSQARDFIREGKMAVVLGIEVDSLFGCKPGVECSNTFIKGQLKKYYDLGVRHVFPIHQYDNGFGGAAIFRNELNAANRVVAGHHFEVRDCSAQGYDYNVEASVATDFLALLLHGAAPPDQDYYDQFAADCNVLGLTTAGQYLINTMMDMGFVIDLDHMSRRATDEVLAIAQERNYPLVSSHTHYDGGNGGSEFSLTDAQLAIMKEIGGMVSAVNPKGECSTSAGFAYQFRKAVSGMAAATGDPFAAVGFSTDMNGFAGSTGPRFFRPSQCGASSEGAPNSELKYPFNGIMGGSFNIQRTGDRDFNFNSQGLAHYGLLADFFADLKNTGLTATELEPLLNSAESYIRLWERTNDVPNTAPPEPIQPSVSAIVTGTKSPNGMAYVSNVQVNWEITGGEGYNVVQAAGCQPVTLNVDTGANGIELDCLVFAFLPTDPTNILATTYDTVTIRRDTTPPSVVWQAASPAAEASGWHNSDVTFNFTVSDAGTGVQSTPAPLVLRTEGTGVTGTVTVTDYAGNSATYTSPAVKIDKTAPAIVLTGVPETNAAGWYRQEPTLTWSCEDALSGAVAAQVSQTLTVEGGAGALTGNCVDLAGNQISDTRSGLKLDKTPPIVDWATAEPVANAAGWHHTDVTLPFTLNDALSGVERTSQPTSLVLTGEGTAVTGTVTVSDVAGNTVTVTSPAVRIDKTAPTLLWADAIPVANAAGWHNTDVAFAFTPSDALSGVATTSAASPLVLAREGTAVNGDISVTDIAGNTATFSSPAVNIDRTPPMLVAPESISTEATSAAGAIVTFGVDASDAMQGPLGAVCAPSSGVVFPIGATEVHCNATDQAGNSSAAAFTVTINDVTTPGEMRGNGFIRDGEAKYQFNFEVRERPSSAEGASFRLRVDEQRGKRNDQFDALTVDFVAFSDDPTVRPGKPNLPQIDTVLFSGSGRWNGNSGYRYEVSAADQGEPGRHRETVRIDIWDPAGALVAHVEGDLDGGNVQSIRIHKGGKTTR